MTMVKLRSESAGPKNASSMLPFTRDPMPTDSHPHYQVALQHHRRQCFWAFYRYSSSSCCTCFGHFMRFFSALLVVAWLLLLQSFVITVLQTSPHGTSSGYTLDLQNFKTKLNPHPSPNLYLATCCRSGLVELCLECAWDLADILTRLAEVPLGTWASVFGSLGSGFRAEVGFGLPWMWG